MNLLSRSKNRTVYDHTKRWLTVYSINGMVDRSFWLIERYNKQCLKAHKYAKILSLPFFLSELNSQLVAWSQLGHINMMPKSASTHDRCLMKSSIISFISQPERPQIHVADPWTITQHRNLICTTTFNFTAYSQIEAPSNQQHSYPCKNAICRHLTHFDKCHIETLPNWSYLFMDPSLIL